MGSDTFSQHPYRCRLDWGRHGARQAAARGDILVIVDILRFSTAVVTAVAHGGIIYPCEWEDDPEAIALRVGAQVAARGRDDQESRRFSLSPLTYLDLIPGTRIVLPSPNGAACSRLGRQAPHLFVGALVNARAVADAVSRLLDSTGACVTVIACGERWSAATEDGELRVALEDYLGAGAVLASLGYETSPEARVCAGAFQNARHDLERLLWECGSGRELREKGFAEDVRHAARLDLYAVVPVMRGESLVEFEG